MSKAPRTTPTERIAGPDWEEGEYAIVKTYLGFLEQYALAQTGGTDTAAGLAAQVLAGVVEWSITYADGTPIPLTEEGVQSLERTYIQYILVKINEFWAAWATPTPPAQQGESAEAAAKRASFRVEGGRTAGTRRATSAR